MNIKPLIVIDAGHGGWDNGAISPDGERLEKNDNLKLALAVQNELKEQEVPVLLTRETDVFVSLQERVQMANEANADLFISLHRNSFPTHTPTTNGLQNYIYLTAPETTARAAQLVVDEIVEVGVQSNWGVLRENFYVLRMTKMSAMLLEMGFIIDPIDNALFDKHLYDYAAAITKGAMKFFGLEYREKPEPPPDNKITYIQNLINQKFNLDMPLSGYFDDVTRHYMISALQIALNRDFRCRLEITGYLNNATMNAIPRLRKCQRGYTVIILQALLWLNSYDAGPLDGVLGTHTCIAFCTFIKDNGIIGSCMPDRFVFKALINGSS